MSNSNSRLADLINNYMGYTHAYDHPVMRKALANVQAAETARIEREAAERAEFNGDEFIAASIRAAKRREEAIENGWDQ